MLPLDALAHVLLLLLLQDQLDEQLLQLLVTVVDAELLETATNKSVVLFSLVSFFGSILG